MNAFADALRPERLSAKWVYMGLEGQTHHVRRETGRSSISMTFERAALPSSDQIAVGEDCVIELEQCDPFGGVALSPPRSYGSIYVYGGRRQAAVYRLLRVWPVNGDRQRTEEFFIEAKALATIGFLMPGEFCALTIRRAVS